MWSENVTQEPHLSLSEAFAYIKVIQKNVILCGWLSDFFAVYLKSVKLDGLDLQANQY